MHGQISFVDQDAESLEDGLDGAAILEGLADDSETGEVDHDPLLAGWVLGQCGAGPGA